MGAGGGGRCHSAEEAVHRGRISRGDRAAAYRVWTSPFFTDGAARRLLPCQSPLPSPTVRRVGSSAWSTVSPETACPSARPTYEYVGPPPSHSVSSVVSMPGAGAKGDAAAVAPLAAILRARRLGGSSEAGGGVVRLRVVVRGWGGRGGCGCKQGEEGVRLLLTP